MSQFDFPRIHFTGKSIIDPATGNNNYHYPLVTYEPVTGTAVMPPRIYICIEKESPSNAKIEREFKDYLQCDESGLKYLEITPINTPQRFKSWNQTPLGEHPHDTAFHELYEVILTKNKNQPLKGQCPGYWNYYGTLNFAFETVKVHSVQILSKKGVVTYTNPHNSPSDIAAILGAELNFNDKNGGNSAVMVDVSPSLSLYSQVFADRMCLEKNKTVLMDGNPSKASHRQTNPRRILNDPSITGASGSFCTSIPMDQLLIGEESPIIHFFKNQGVSNKILKGVFVRYDLFELEEDQSPDYALMGATSNPARSTVLGCLAPWYHGEMSTAAPGRLLLPLSAYLGKNQMGSALAYFHKVHNLLSLDVIGCFPEEKHETDPPCYSLYDLGELQIVIADEAAEYEIGRIQVGYSGLDRKAFLAVGGIVDISLLEDNVGQQQLIQGGELRVYANTLESEDSVPSTKLVLRESKYRVISDQTGLYAEQGDSPTQGFLSNSAEKQPCKIRVLRHGKPVREPVEMSVLKISINPYGCGETLEVLDSIEKFYDEYVFEIDTSKPANVFYAFFPVDGGVFPGDIKNYMLTTGAFINARILPKFDLEKYLDGGQGVLDFNLIYSEFLIHYDLIYPASGIITPFKAGHLKKISAYLYKLMTKGNWDRYRYMPSSRDMPEGKRALLFQWLENEIKS